MRPIDADALNAEMYRKSFEVDDGRNVWNSGLWIRYKIFEEAIKDAPTIDAVPVIRCKNCKHYSTDTWGVVNGLPLIIAHNICDFWGDGCKTDPEGFCFMGEKNERDG